MARCVWSKDGICQTLIRRADGAPFPCEGRQSCLGKCDELVDLRDLKTEGGEHGDEKD